METQRGKDAAKAAIITSIELSYSLDGWFRKEMIKELKKR